MIYEGLLVTAELVRGEYIAIDGGDNKVITTGIVDAGGRGVNGTVITRAFTAFDDTGMNHVNAVEGAIVVRKPGDNTKMRWAFNAVVKIRNDDSPPGPRTNLRNSAGYIITAHEEVRAEFGVWALPRTVFGALINAPGNPGATLCNISSDMLVEIAGKRCIPVRVDGEIAGIPLIFQ